MSMFNANVISKLPIKEAAENFCTLSSQGVTFSFLINPEKYEEKYTAEFASLPVLLTPQAQLKYKSTDSKLSFPKVLFRSPANNLDVSTLLSQLKTWIGSGTQLTLTYGILTTQCYISSFSYTTIQIRSGAPTQVEGSIEFLKVPTTPKSSTQPTLNSTPTAREKSLNKAS